MYYAIAYRWGCTNDHWYMVAIGTHQEDVEAEAEIECRDRGGKYGVEVCCAPEDGGEVQVAYFPSMFGEKRPRKNVRAIAAENIGLCVLAATEVGERMLADPENPGFMKLAPVEVPPWLKDETKRQLDYAQMLWGERESE